MGFLVADSGPLIALGIADLIPIAASIYQPLIVPEAVLNECLHDASRPAAAQIKAALTQGHIIRVETEALESQSADIGAGEASVIQYAKAHKLTAILDDRRAIATARRLGVALVRSGALVLDLKRISAITAIRPILDMWQAHGYFLSPEIRSTLLEAAGE